MPLQLKPSQIKSMLPVLQKARKLLTQVGWCKHQMQKTKLVKNTGKRVITHFCALGALHEACRQIPSATKNRLTNATCLLTAMANHYGFYAGITGFNDASGRRKYQVIRVFDDAITKTKQLLYVAK